MTEQSFQGHRQIPVRHLPQHIGETVLVQGWLYNMRSKGKLHFLEVRDGTGIVQCVVFKGEVADATFEAAGKLTQESSLRVVGVVKADARQRGGVELGVVELQVVQVA